eukprot:CAMPEP_0115007088 /NCGR_PEP_ID=MMETSP0216-20121206/20935_1 /TAXON_ID=223996 /ORGANISM="Protocruzia adherens, Strain Boccale" /LENGTH=514 /DNA_ID=CAMNT_0002373891 /DNA_START=76 /DNA_END=1616 /DNA_ORIENTATION=-
MADSTLATPSTFVRNILLAIGVVAVGRKFYLNEKAKREADEVSNDPNESRLKSKKFAKTSSLLIEELKTSAAANYEHIPHLAEQTDDPSFEMITSPMLGSGKYRSVYGGDGYLAEHSFVSEKNFILGSSLFEVGESLSRAKKFLRAGPRRDLYFKPEEVCAAVVTCGGLCPGLNVVIREIVMNLRYNYRVRRVYGIPFGYRGFYEEELIELTPHVVQDIHKAGGTVLGSSRGGFDLERILETIEERGINQLYIVGGDGTHRGIKVLFDEIAKRGLKVSVVGVPKTIDNDIPIIDKSFGFDTAVEEAQRAINSANIEATAAPHGIGLVKLMGRHSGFIARDAVLANRDVNVCLIPESPFEVEGENGFLANVYKRVIERKHAVIVVAEGAADAMLDAKLEGSGTDASGNKRLPEIGKYLRDKLLAYFREREVELTLKYIDPTYMIRTVAANSSDTKMCAGLATAAVHGAMAGYTGFSVGFVKEHIAYIPIKLLNSMGSRQIRVENDIAWFRVLENT